MLAVLDGHDRQLGARVALVLHGLIIAAAATFAISTVPGLPPLARRALIGFEAFATAVFFLEYVLRLWAAPNRLRYALSFWGIIDLLAWAPALFLGSSAGATLRLLRLVLVLRILKLVRYNRAVRRLGRAVRMARDELTIFFFAALFLLYLSAVGIYFFEHPAQPEAFSSVPEAFWWAVITLTTVGYGDAVPITAPGQIFTVLILFLGMGVFAVPAGVIASALISRELEEAVEEAIEEVVEERVEERVEAADGAPTDPLDKSQASRNHGEARASHRDGST